MTDALRCTNIMRDVVRRVLYIYIYMRTFGEHCTPVFRW